MARFKTRLQRLRRSGAEAAHTLLTRNTLCLALAAVLLWGGGAKWRSPCEPHSTETVASAQSDIWGAQYSSSSSSGQPPYVLPRLIHQTVEDIASMSCQARESVQTWIDMNPGYRHRLYDAAARRTYVMTHFPNLLPLYLALPSNVERADMWRYLALLHEGGIYADSDVRCMAPIDTWNSGNGHDAALLVGVAKRNHANMTREFNQFVIAAMPGHPVLAAMPITVAANFAIYFLRGQAITASGVSHDVGVLSRTGPGAFTAALQNYATRVGAAWPINATAADAHGGVLFGSVRAMPKLELGMGWETVDTHLTCDQVKATLVPQALVCHQFFGTWKQSPEADVALTYSGCAPGLAYPEPGAAAWGGGNAAASLKPSSAGVATSVLQW